MSKIKTIGAIEKNGRYYCENCNNDLSSAGALKCVAHADGPQKYAYIYNCTICGHIIKREHHRR